MRRLAVAAVFVCAVAAHAQSVDLDVGGLHAGIHVEGDVAPAPAPQQVVVVQQQPPPRVIGADTFRVDYAVSPQPRLVVTQPEGALAQVWGEDGLEGQYTVPFSFLGRSDRYYRVILSAADGTPLFDRKVELRSWKQATLSMRRAQVVVAAPPPVVVVQAAPAAPAGLAAADFAAIVSAVEGEDFSSDKLGVIRTAVSGGAYFSCAQVGQLVDLLDMSDDKVQVVELTRSRLVDPHNGFALASHFTFSTDKEKVRKLLAQ